ncbi:hypothetical protein Taro_024940, partial [Colocasia esculenta]|nr:hypothetical protein [Colocasia esculenta]
NPFLGAVRGGTTVCSSLTSWSARGVGRFCLSALDLVEVCVVLVVCFGLVCLCAVGHCALLSRHLARAKKMLVCCVAHWLSAATPVCVTRSLVPSVVAPQCVVP